MSAQEPSEFSRSLREATPEVPEALDRAVLGYAHESAHKNAHRQRPRWLTVPVWGGWLATASVVGLAVLVTRQPLPPEPGSEDAAVAVLSRPAPAKMSSDRSSSVAADSDTLEPSLAKELAMLQQGDQGKTHAVQQPPPSPAPESSVSDAKQPQRLAAKVPAAHQSPAANTAPVAGTMTAVTDAMADRAQARALEETVVEHDAVQPTEAPVSPPARRAGATPSGVESGTSAVTRSTPLFDSPLLSFSQPRSQAPRSRAAPWQQAAARGVQYRAVGNEPGWSLAVTATTVTLETDYGQQRVEFPVPEAGLSDLPWRNQVFTNGENKLRVDLRRTPCVDSMSGERFPLQARVSYGDQVLRGCGRDLR